MRIQLPTSRCSTLLIATLIAVSGSASPQGTPIGFEEDFALSTDRERVLAELLPGTEEYYYYHCLHLQNEGDLEGVAPLLAGWIQRHGRTSRAVEIENRQALLGYERDPGATFEFLRRRLGLRFDHQRQAPGARPDLPTRLERRLVSWDTLALRAMQAHPGTFDGFRDAALERFVATQLDDDHLKSLLARLRRPDVPNLPALVVRDLENRRSHGFGSQPIHDLLLLDQLEECVRLRPALLDDGAFVHAVLRRLQPNPDVDWRRDAREREAWLGRLQAFSERLSPAHNSLKAHVLHHRLLHDLAAGEPSRERLLAYLRLPRQTRYVRPEYLRGLRPGEVPVDPSTDFPTGLGPIGDDEPLVRAYLERFLRDADGWDAWSEYVREDWLKRVFAETKILAGIGDMERWYSLLDDPAYYEALERRVEIEFDPTQRRWFGAEEPVSLDLQLKNVGKLLVKVFAIDSFTWYREQDREIDALIDLDGLVANEEHDLAFEHPALRRFPHRLELPGLAQPGVWVVELIGNGLSSRAVIRKGRLQVLERPSAAGHVFRVLDEHGRVARDATLWFAGGEHAADQRGEIRLPYTSEPGTKSVIARHGELCALETFEHRGEDYRLEAGFYVDREDLLAGGSARLLVRPNLMLNGLPVTISILEGAVLSIAAVDQRGVGSALEVGDLELSDDGELVHELEVPRDLATLTVGLRGKVRSLTRAEPIELAPAQRVFSCNGMEATALTACPLLGRSAEGWVLDLLGKDGEPKAGRPLELTLEHRDFTEPVVVSLQTDDSGRIHVGELEGFTSLRSSGLPDEVGSFDLGLHRRSLPHRLHGLAGETLRVPWEGGSSTATRSELSLLETRGGAFVRDAFDHLSVAEGFLELRGLPAGDYDLWLKTPDRHVSVRIGSGEARAGWVLGADRRLERGPSDRLAVTSLRIDGDELVVSLAHAGQDARVHVVATRYLAPFDPFASLVAPATESLRVARSARPESSYHSGRAIGDEYRYILERRFARKFPGNMLARPGLLLNPWALEETITQVGAGGGASGRFGARAPATGRGTADDLPRMPIPVEGSPGAFASLEFLPQGSRLVANLRPDESGHVRAPLAELGDGQLLHVLALDRRETAWLTQVRDALPLVPRPRHLARALDSERHFAEQRDIELVPAGGVAVIPDVASAQAEVVDSLATVLRQYLALSGDADLAAFSFVLRWPELTPEEKRSLYSQHACHELHFFLHEKDPDFFDEVVRPYLAHKADKTFLDDWLLGNDLARYLDPWSFARLNVVERILLSRRIEGQLEAVVGHVDDLCDLLPPDPERSRHLFETALAGLALGAEVSIAAAIERAREELEAGKSVEGSRRSTATPGPGSPAASEERARAGEDFRFDAAADEPSEEQRDADARAELRELFRMPDRTRRWVESNYWRRRIQEQDGSLIVANEFWRDYARSRGTRPFLSDHYAEATGSFAEMMLALAVLDLPFRSAEHETEGEGGEFRLRAETPLLLVRKEIRPAADAQERGAILVAQNYYRLDERFRWSGNERLDAWVEDEFVVDVAYGCQVVVTNPTSAPRQLELLLQVPSGALPLQRGFLTRGTSLRLEPYSTSTIEYAFYFPAPGTATHYPVQVGVAGAHVASAAPSALPVVAEATSVDSGSWEHVSQQGTSDEVLRFLESENLGRIDLSRIAWRMKEREFYDAALARLRRRHAYADVLWSYGLLARDPLATREYLRHADGFLAQCGNYLESELVTVDPVERRSFELVEYAPLFNPRAHRFGRERRILNADLAAQYRALLEILAYRPQLDDEDWLTVTYYLLLQDRVEEALDGFARVDPARVPERLQYDSMSAYLAFFTQDLERARSIAQAWSEHPVERWRQRFREILGQLDELEGAAAGVRDPQDRTQRQTALAAGQSDLELVVEAGRITVRAGNVERCELRYHEMDVEFLFSTHPFVQQSGDAFAWVRPHRSEVHEIPESGVLELQLPERFRSANVLIEARAGGVARRQAHYANSLALRLVETYGQLQVSDAATGQPLPRVYVKAYAREPGGGVRFHKDGYTDLRGRFDYVSLSGEGAGGAERYALLVLSEQHGAVIREAAPPAR